jgi:hypothetical protein
MTRPDGICRPPTQIDSSGRHRVRPPTRRTAQLADQLEQVFVTATADYEAVNAATPDAS